MSNMASGGGNGGKMTEETPKEKGINEFCESKYLSENFNFGDFPPEDERHFESYKEDLLFDIKEHLNKGFDKALQEQSKQNKTNIFNILNNKSNDDDLAISKIIDEITKWVAKNE